MSPCTMMPRSSRSAARSALAILGGTVALLGAGCATVPNADLERARTAYEAVVASDQTAAAASVELYEAQKTLRHAEQAQQEGADPEEVSNLAYIAERRVEIARATAREKAALERVEQLGGERAEVLIRARTLEGERAVAAARAARKRADELERALTELQARETTRGLVLTLGGVLFDFDEATLAQGARQKLSQVAQYLLEHAEREVLIEGFTDNYGPEEYNLALSQRRADTVRSVLIGFGVPARRMVARGYGERFAVLSNASPAGRQSNRRVEIVILEPGQRAAAQAPRSEPPAVGAGPR